MIAFVLEAILAFFPTPKSRFVTVFAVLALIGVVVVAIVTR